MQQGRVYGFVKPLVDVHTMGLYTMANLLRDCGCRIFVAGDDVNAAIENISLLNNYGMLKRWITVHGIDFLCFSYRLDPQDGSDYFAAMYQHLKSDKMFVDSGGPLKGISFAGLPQTCDLVKNKIGGEVLLFRGNETPSQSLRRYGIPERFIPHTLTDTHPYDNMRWSFAKTIVESEQYHLEKSQDHYGYPECGKANDNYLARLNYAMSRHTLPLIRTHCGPYHPSRIEALKEFYAWCQDLSQSRLLDILSIGSSQLTQSHFGENWEGLSNGGGVPVNSEEEYRMIKELSSPMLVRTYSGTKNVPEMAKMHERSLNISWHALSFWWFNEIDGRGHNTLLENLREHFDAIRYIATTGKPVEPNVPHHFAFRGSDDITFILSGYLAAKACKIMGIRHLILQDMLNTPKYTWGIQDLAKGRAMLKLIRELEDNNFQVSLQLRAGLDYFCPDLEKAKIQLAAVTCMMDDMEPENDSSPEIIHVVNYCEAVRLADPSCIKESIKITLFALHEYRKARREGYIPNMKFDKEVQERTDSLYEEARDAISFLEKNFTDLYTPEGFYRIFTEGFLPVPYLSDPNRKYPKASKWHTAIKNGGIRVVDDDGNVVDTLIRYRRILSEMDIDRYSHKGW